MELPLETLEGIVDTLNVGLVVLDKDDKIVLFNRKPSSDAIRREQSLES
jgi:hypothetical protein